MEFDKSVYEEKLTKLVNSIYSSIQVMLDTPEWVGTICSLDIIPSNGNLYPIELNTNLLLINDSLNEWDLNPIINYIKDNGYKRCIFRRHGNELDWQENVDDVYIRFNREFTQNGIEFVQQWHMNGILPYHREFDTDFILQQRWNSNLIDNLAANKNSFLSHLSIMGVDTNSIPKINKPIVEEYDYNLDYPSYFYKLPTMDSGKSAYPIIIDSSTNINSGNFSYAIRNDEKCGTRVEICKRNIVGKNFILDLEQPDKEYVYYAKFEKTNVYDTQFVDSGGNLIKSNFKKTNKTHIWPTPNFVEGNVIEMADGSFKDVKDVVDGDIIRYYRFNNYNKLNYEYFLDYSNYFEKYLTEYTWVEQERYLNDDTWRNINNYTPIDIAVKFTIQGKAYKIMRINNELNFIKNRHVVYFSKQHNYFRHDYTDALINGGDFLQTGGNLYSINTCDELEYSYNTYGFIINEYDLYDPYFVNMNGIFVLVY